MAPRSPQSRSDFNRTTVMKRIKTIKVTGPMELTLLFDNGKTIVKDFKSLAAKGGVFARLRDRKFFAKVKLSEGTVLWPGDLDLCPDVLYDGGKESRKKMNLPGKTRKTKLL
jgi:hypothetical protein